jgi:hypothetical protein
MLAGSVGQTVRADGFSRDFSRDAFKMESSVMEGLIASDRVSPVEKHGVQLRGDGALVTAANFGPGVYHVRFQIDESDPKFKYHTPKFVFSLQEPSRVNDIATIQSGFDFYAIVWRNTGEVLFEHVVSEGEDRKTERLGLWQEPGPAPETKYTKDAAVDLTIVVPSPGGDIQVFLKKTKPEGTPNCTFKLPEGVQDGAFGFMNGKWYSTVWMHALDFTPAVADETPPAADKK